MTFRRLTTLMNRRMHTLLSTLRMALPPLWDAHNLRLQADGPGVGSIKCKQGKRLGPVKNRPLEGA